MAQARVADPTRSHVSASRAQCPLRLATGRCRRSGSSLRCRIRRARAGMSPPEAVGGRSTAPTDAQTTVHGTRSPCQGNFCRAGNVTANHARRRPGRTPRPPPHRPPLWITRSRDQRPAAQPARRKHDEARRGAPSVPRRVRGGAACGAYRAATAGRTRSTRSDASSMHPAPTISAPSELSPNTFATMAPITSDTMICGRTMKKLNTPM